jgi:hypothetical protein
MAEYRVTALHYRFVSETDLDSFATAAPWSGSRGTFSCALSDGVLTAIPAVEFRDRDAAKRALEPHLRAWEQGAFLSPSAYRIRFEYDHSDVEEVDPQPGSLTLFPEMIGAGVQAFAPTITRGNAEHPSVDPFYVRSPLTDQLVERLRRTRDGGETWPAFAYFVLTRIKAEFGGEKGAIAALAVSRNVLGGIGTICAKGDPDIGRKAGRTPETITSSERAWLEAVVVRLIHRVGENAAGGTLPQITMADFPPLH